MVLLTFSFISSTTEARFSLAHALMAALTKPVSTL
jgi:hypothetical protein